MALITVLRVSEKNKLAAKKIYLDVKGAIQKTKFDAGTFFCYSQKEIGGIEQLSSFLFDLAHDSQTFLIRGELAKNKNPDELVRRLGVKGHGEEGFFLSVPQGQPWILLDFDGIPTPNEIDFLKHPEKGIEYLVSLLSDCFHGVTYHYHLSSSAGLDGGKTIRAHLWYWLDHPVTDDQLRVWAKKCNCSFKLIDENLFSAVQPYYTSDPIFIDVVDPFPTNRSGLVKGKSDEVVFPIISVKSITYAGNTEGLSPTENFNKYLSAVGDHDGGMGFHKPLMMAVWYYVQEHGSEGTDKIALKQAIKDVIAKADYSKHTHAEIIQKGSDAHLDGLIDGALVKLGAKGKTGKIEGLEPYYQHQEVLSSQKADEKLQEIVRSFFDNPRNVGIRAGAGLGKTTQVIASLANLWMHDKRVEYYLPTHKLGGEVAGKLKYHPFKKPKLSWQKGSPTGVLWQVIRGRNQPTKTGELHCLKNHIASLLAERGHPIYPLLCRSGEETCEYFGECQYIRQFNGEYDVRIFPHAYLALDRGYLDGDITDYAVIDESFYTTLLSGIGSNSKPILLAEVMASGWPPDLIKALVLAQKDKPLLSYLREQFGEDTLISIIDEALSVFGESEKPNLFGLSVSEQLKAVKELKATPKIEKLLSVLRQEVQTGRDISHGVIINDHGFIVRYRKPITRFRGKHLGVIKRVPVLAIDADLITAVHCEFFPDAEIHEINTERNCHVIQCYSTKNSKTSLTIDEKAHIRTAQIQKVINRIAEEKSVLVVGPEIITGNTDKLPAKVKVSDGSELAHFNALRGIDKYKDMDAILVISRNQPALNSIEDLACALWFDAEEPLKIGVKSPIEEPRGYRTRSNYRVGVNVDVHPDPRVQTLMELIRESETLQGIDRLRLVHGNELKRVFLLSNLVLDLTVDNLLSWEEMIEGTTKLNEAWRNLDGVLPLNPKWLSEKFPDLFLTENSVKSYLKSVGRQLGQLSNNIIIRNPTQLKIFAYAIVGQTGPQPKCLSKFGRNETKKRLENLLGKAVISIKKVE